MKKLKNILYGLELIAIRGSNEIMISGISIDSKKSTPFLGYMNNFILILIFLINIIFVNNNKKIKIF